MTTTNAYICLGTYKAPKCKEGEGSIKLDLADGTTLKGYIHYYDICGMELYEVAAPCKSCDDTDKCKHQSKITFVLSGSNDTEVITCKTGIFSKVGFCSCSKVDSDKYQIIFDYKGQCCKGNEDTRALYDNIGKNTDKDKVMTSGFKSKTLEEKMGLVHFDEVKNYNSSIVFDDNVLTIKEKNYYKIELYYEVIARCPVETIKVSLKNKATGQVLATSQSNSGQENTFSYSATIDKDTQFVFTVEGDKGSGFSCLSIIGLATKDTEMFGQLENRTQTMADDANSKRQFITSIAASQSFLTLPSKPQTVTVNDIIVGGTTGNEVIPWTANTIPWRTGEASRNGGVFSNGTTGTVNYYQKFRSIADVLAYYAGVDFRSIPKDSERLTVFTRDFPERGGNNFTKLTYQYAITADKLHHYSEKMDTAVNTFFTLIASTGKPVISTFKRELINFFLAVHIGYYTYPDYVVEYFSDFTNVVGLLDNPASAPLLLKGRLIQPKVTEYFKEKATEAIQNGDESTLVYWWALAGFSLDSLVSESLHNIIAFIQFANTTYRIFLDSFWKNSGYTSPVPPQPYIHKPTYPLSSSQALLYGMSTTPYFTYDFLAKFKSATTDEDRLNVVREVFRLLVPNGAAFSLVKGPNLPNDIIRSVHQWTQIMIACQSITTPQATATIPLYITAILAAQGITGTPTPAQLSAATAQARQLYQAQSYFQYKAGSAYTNFTTSFNSSEITVPTDDLDDPIDLSKYLGYSAVDNDAKYNDGTVIDKTNSKIVPIYDKTTTVRTDATAEPYMPFGVGYRRCPGESFTYLFFVKLLNRIKDLKVEFRSVTDPVGNVNNPDLTMFTGLAPRNMVLDNMYVIHT